MATFPQYKNVTAPDLSNLIALQSQGTRNAFNSLADIGNTIQGIQQKNIDRDNRNLLAQGMLAKLNQDPNVVKNIFEQAVNDSNVPINLLNVLGNNVQKNIDNQRILDNQKNYIKIAETPDINKPVVINSLAEQSSIPLDDRVLNLGVEASKTNLENKKEIEKQRAELDLYNQNPTNVGETAQTYLSVSNTPLSKEAFAFGKSNIQDVNKQENVLKANEAVVNSFSNNPEEENKNLLSIDKSTIINSGNVTPYTNAVNNSKTNLLQKENAETLRNIALGNNIPSSALNAEQFSIQNVLKDTLAINAIDQDLKKKTNPANYSPTQTYTSPEKESLDKNNQFTQYMSQKEKEITQSNLPLLAKTQKLNELESYKTKFVRDLAKEQINKGNITSPEEVKKIFPGLSDKEANSYINDAKANGIIYTTQPKQTPGSYGFNVEVARNDVISQVNIIKNSNKGLYDYTKFSNTTNDIKKVGKTEIKQKLIKDFKDKSGITDAGIEESLSDVKDAYKRKQLEEPKLPSVSDEEILAVLDMTSSYDGYIWDKFDGQDWNDQQTNLLNKLIAFKKPENQLLYQNIQTRSKLLDDNIKSLQKDIDGLLIKANNAKTEPFKKNVQSDLEIKVKQLEALQTDYENLYARGN